MRLRLGVEKLVNKNIFKQGVCVVICQMVSCVLDPIVSGLVLIDRHQVTLVKHVHITVTFRMYGERWPTFSGCDAGKFGLSYLYDI